jgi:hypothetical protein
MFRRLALLLMVLAWSPVAFARPVKSLLEFRQEGVVIQKWDNSCGAAALATVLTYYMHHPIGETAVAQGLLRQTEPLKVRHRGGFSLLDMRRYLASIGYRGEGYSGLTWDDLRSYTPSIVPIKQRGYDHFVVLRGITDSHAVIADPGFGNYRLTRTEFLESWTSGIAFVVTKGGTPNEDPDPARHHDSGPGGTGFSHGSDERGSAAPAR